MYFLASRTDKPTPLINKGQPRVPGNYLTWNRLICGWLGVALLDSWSALVRAWKLKFLTL